MEALLQAPRPSSNANIAVEIHSGMHRLYLSTSRTPHVHGLCQFLLLSQRRVSPKWQAAPDRLHVSDSTQMLDFKAGGGGGGLWQNGFCGTFF